MESSVVARHLRVHGWSWSDELLGTVVRHLEDEGILLLCDLLCLDVGDIQQAATWPLEVRSHVQKVVSRRSVPVVG